MKVFLTTLLIIITVFFASSAEAGLITANEINHGTEEVFEENTTIATKIFNSEAVYNRDLMILAEEIVLNAYTQGDLLFAAKDIIISGEVLGDVRVIGGSVTIEGIIQGDIFVFGGTVRTTKDAIVRGSTIVLGGEFIHEGLFVDDVKVISGEVTVDGEVRDDIVITTQELNMGKNSIVNQDALNQYFSPKQAEGHQEVLSSFEYSKTNTWYQKQNFQSGISMFFGFWSILKFITNSILIFLLYFIFKGFIESVRQQGSVHWVRSGFVGLAAVIGIPAIAVLLMVSLIGFPIGVILLILVWLLFILRSTLASFILSVWVIKIWNHYSKKKIANNQYNIVISSIAGLAILSLLSGVPYLGSIVISAISAIGIGATLIIVYKIIIKR